MFWYQKDDFVSDPLTLFLFHQHKPDIGKILSSHQKIIKKSPQLRKLFKDQPLCSFRRDTSLADIMVHQKTAKVLKKNPLPKLRLQGKCGRKCVICKKSFRGELKTSSGRVIKINKKINCRTSNVVYAVHCKKCKHIVYVGETETMLKGSDTKSSFWYQNI